MRSFAIIIPQVLFLLCCDTTEMIDLGERAPLLTVASFPDNNAYWNVQLGLSTGILDTVDFPGVPGASVTILENGAFLEKLTCTNPDDPLISVFKSATGRPMPGKTYGLEVNAQGFPLVSATYTQPLPVAVDSLVVSVMETGRGYQRMRIQVHLADQAGDDYYALLFIGLDSTDTEGRSWSTVSLFADQSYNQETAYFGTSLAIFQAFSDASFEGKKVLLDLETTFYSSDFSSDAPMAFPTDVTVHLRHLSKENFLFIQSIYLQGRTSFDPLAQPVQIKSNIKNGLGIFAGYTETSKTVPITN